MADYKLTVTGEGDCEVILPAGSDFVRTLYPESKCVAIIAAADGKVEKSEFDGFLKVGDGDIFVAAGAESGVHSHSSLGV